MPDQPMLAPCGIDCAACDICLAARDAEAAARLAEQWRSWNADARPEWFRCQGCRGDRNLRWCEDCQIAACCEEKRLRDCSQCPEFACQAYLNWIGPYAHHQAAYERLEQMAEETMDGR